MDVEKEREAFEAYMAEKYKNLMDRRQCLNNGGGYMAWDMNVAWQVWQAAKAQAVPDGFVVVPKEPTPKMIDATWDFDEEIQDMSHNSRNEFIYNAMIAAAQEPTND